MPRFRSTSPAPTRLAAGTGLRVAFALAVLLAGDPVWGYRFYRSLEDDSRAPHSDTALRWRETAWGPGDTLVWHVLDDPRWQPHFSGPEEALPLVEESLDIWAQVPGADVRWRVAGVLTGEEFGRDGRNTVSVEELEDFAGYASWWMSRRRGGPWETEECDVQLAPGHLEYLSSDEASSLNVLLHEFGHCLGLSHAAATPTIRLDWPWTDSSIWRSDPKMSYGVDTDNTLSEDEVIGASLLRPVPGWGQTTGSISGRVLHDGGPAAFVSVHVLRNDGGRARPSVQVFTGEDGRFLAEGLVPGEYVVWIHPMLRTNAHASLLSAGAVTDTRDLLSIRRFRVHARQETPAGEFTLDGVRDQR